MPTAPDALFKAIANPTRRVIFERLCRDGEQTVWMLTADADVSQRAVSKHLGVLKLTDLVRERREGRQPTTVPSRRAEAPHRLDEPLRRVLARPVRPS